MSVLASSAHDLRTLVQSFHPVVAIESSDEERVGRILREVARELGASLFEWSVTRGLVRQGAQHAIAGTAEPIQLLAHLQGLTVRGLYWLKDLAPHLADPICARRFREVATRFAHTPSAMVLTGGEITLPSELAAVAAFYTLRMPGREELREVVRSVLEGLRSQSAVQAELGPAALDRVLAALAGMTLNQARQAVARVVLEEGRLDPDDTAALLREKASQLAAGGLLEYFPVEDNRFELAGFGRMKEWLERARLGFSPEARALDLAPPRGVLLAGVQGCGKSLAAKAIARAWGLPLVKLDAGALLDKYLGESERNLRRATAQAESLAPCVLWIDEIEKGLAPDAGESGGVGRRMLGTLLTWLQEHRAPVFLVATANDVFALPPELMRKGRFDELFFVDLPDPAERLEILRVHLRARHQDPEKLELGSVLDETDGFSGAELEQAVIAALYRSLHDRSPLASDHLLHEIRSTRPLSLARREEIERLRTLARERFVPVR